MAVLGRLLVSSAERLDLPDFLSIDSYVQGDFKYLLNSFVGDSKPFVLKGFDVINPGNSIGTQNVSIRVANSVVYYPGSSAGPFFFGLEEGNTMAAPLVPELRKNATNYVYLTLSTTEAGKDTRAFWDPDKNGGDGGEFTQDVNTQSVLSVAVNVSVASFPENTIPICKVVVGPNFITSIQDCRDMLFRLGSGGLNPNPLSQYSWRANPSSTYTRSEPNTTMTNALDPNPFQGGDKNIQTLKEWMDAVMTKLAELGGTTYWYEDTSVYNLINVFKDSLATSIKSKGVWASSSNTAGMLTWSEDILLQSSADLSETIIRSGSKIISNDEVMYINRVRDAAINTGGVDVQWYNGVDHVNGQLGAFENLSKGDWVKKADDSDNLFLRVEEFYAAANKGGGVTAPGNALSIRLSAPYAGISESKQASYTKGVYLASEVSVVPRSSSLIQQAAGNFYWLALRSDTILNVSNIATTTLSIDITNHDGVQAKVTSIAHGLSDGQRIQISGSTNFDGIYSVAVETVDVFYIQVAGGPFANELAQSAHYATVTTSARSTSWGLQLESSSHALSKDQKAIIAGTSNFNGEYQVFPTGNTTYTIPFSSAAATETTGTSTAVNIYVRTDIGPTKLERGETKGIGETESVNLMLFMGMDNAAQQHPIYNVPSSYGTIWGMEHYNSLETDNLTSRVSKLTAMMADKAQDKTIKYAENYNSINNLTSGSDQLITFIGVGTPTVDIVIPSSTDFKNTITLSGTLTLAQNKAAYFEINRNSSFSIANLNSLTVVDIDQVPLNENVYIFAYRLDGTDCYLYNNKRLRLGGNPINNGGGVVKVRLRDNFNTTLPVGTPVTIDNILVTDQTKILFTNLSTNNNRIYTANVTAGSVVSWNPEYEFGGFQDPEDGDLVSIQEGLSFGDTLARYTGSQFEIDFRRRAFNGNDYFEESALLTSIINNNQSSPDVLTSFNYVGSEYSIIDYSISRGTSRETGSIKLSTDGVSVSLSNDASNISSSGVTISADISGSLLRLLYTSDNTGSAGVFKFSVKRWSNSAGGPGGLPSYSGGTGGGGGGGTVTSSGAPLNGEIAIFTSPTDITSNSNFKIDTSTSSLNLNGLYISSLQGPYTLIDNTLLETTLVSFDPILFPFVIIEYSIERAGERRVGRLMITHNGSVSNISDDFSPTSDLGIVFSSDLSGSNLRLKYTATSTGSNATMKFSTRKWA